MSLHGKMPSKLAIENKLRPYNNSIATQCKRVLEALTDRPQSTFDLRRQGIVHPGGRMRDLRDLGYNIVTHFIRQADENNVFHRIALYVLHAHKDELNV